MQHELTAGLEIHQQLNTGKLFCACPSNIRDDPADVIVTRVLRAAAGESGETDIAAKHEQHKAKQFVYHGYSDSTCLVEFDEEPVSSVNNKALQAALVVAKMLGLNVLDELHVMRKTVVDGSNTSGFQRTMLVGVNGKITVGGKQIHIEQLCLEEDSAKIIERQEFQDSYNLSRLGIPLLEITTGPDLHSPQEVKQVAAYLGMLLRSTDTIKRGLGSIRQDVNVSIPGGARVEIKGAQDLDSLSLLVEYEAQRQRALSNLAGAIPKNTYVQADITTALHEVKSGFIGKALLANIKAIGVRLPGWKEYLHSELAPGARLGKELAGYAKAHGFGGLIHSAEDPSKYSFSDTTVQNIRASLNCVADDAWLFLLGPSQRVQTFLEHILIPRLHQMSKGVPSEVRKAEVDGTTSYLRPMPGASRMYPETDVLPIHPDVTTICVPELLTERAKRIATTYNISQDLADQLARESLISTFEQWTKQFSNVPASIVANLLVTKERELKTRYNIEIDIVALGPAVLERLDASLIALTSVDEILMKLATKQPLDWSAYKVVDQNALQLIVQQIVRENPGATAGLLMGKIMRACNGAVDGRIVNQLVQDALGGK